MDIDEAIKILDELFSKPEISDDDEPLYIECLSLLANSEGHELCSEAQYYLGDYYNSNNRSDLALKYWKQSAENGFVAAYAGLGDIYFYGKLGESDYQNAFYHYSKGAEKNNRYCKYMIADMYRDGLFVKKNFNHYKSLIEKLYNENKEKTDAWSIMPDIVLRLARIRRDEGITDSAINLYYEAIEKYADVISNRKYGAYISRILEIYNELYQLINFDYDNLNIYNISYLMKEPARIIFMYRDKSYTIESIKEDNNIIIHFEGKWYKDIDDFYQDAKIEDASITTLAYDFYGFEVIK